MATAPRATKTPAGCWELRCKQTGGALLSSRPPALLCDAFSVARGGGSEVFPDEGFGKTCV